MTTTMAPQRNIVDLLKSLFAPAPEQRRYGRASFVVGEDGEYTHVATEFTVKPNPGEGEEAFLARVRRDYREPGDAIEFTAEAGRTVVARVTRRPRE